MRVLNLSEAAQEDISQAFNWYENQKSGLGTDYLTEISDLLADIEKNHERFPIRFEDVRVAKMKKFPYMIFFEEIKKELIVFQVVHNRRDPGKWRKKS